LCQVGSEIQSDLFTIFCENNFVFIFTQVIFDAFQDGGVGDFQSLVKSHEYP
jgi:hypothetical protein